MNTDYSSASRPFARSVIRVYLCLSVVDNSWSRLILNCIHRWFQFCFYVPLGVLGGSIIVLGVLAALAIQSLMLTAFIGGFISMDYRDALLQTLHQPG
jgi:hypothetical protein